MHDEISEDIDERDVYTMQGFDKCEECDKFLESYQIKELVSANGRLEGMNRTLIMFARSKIYYYAVIEELYRPKQH